MQRNNLTLQRLSPLHTTFCSKEDAMGIYREGLFKLILMLYSSNLSERKDINNNKKSHHSEARGENGAVLRYNPAGTGRTVGFIEAVSSLLRQGSGDLCFKQPSGSCRAAEVVPVNKWSFLASQILYNSKEKILDSISLKINTL